MAVLNKNFLSCAAHRRQWCHFSEDCSLREIGAPWAPGLGARGEFQFALRDQADNDVVHWIYWKLLRIRSPVKMWLVCVNAVAAKWMTGPPEWTDLGYSPTQLDAFNGRDEVTGGKRNLHLTVWPVGRMGACRMFHLKIGPRLLLTGAALNPISLETLNPDLNLWLTAGTDLHTYCASPRVQPRNEPKRTSTEMCGWM